MRAVNHHVERRNDSGTWMKLFGADGARGFCEGWVACMDSMYPSPPMRIIATFADGSTKVIRETKGRRGVHLNTRAGETKRAT